MSATQQSESVWVNGSPQPLEGPTALLSVLERLGLAARKGIAAAVNGEVVPRPSWGGRILSAGDQVVVIRATQGG